MKTNRYSDVVKYQKWAFISGFFTGTFATAISLILYFILCKNICNDFSFLIN